MSVFVTIPFKCMKRNHYHQFLFRFMRLSFLQLMIIVAALGNVHATVGNAQPALEKKLTLKLRNERVETIFQNIYGVDIKKAENC